MTAQVENAEAVATENTEATEEVKAPAVKKTMPSTAQRLIGTPYESWVNEKGSFNPGYDAKAKSAMIKDAIEGDNETSRVAIEVIEKMNWTGHLNRKRETIANQGAAAARRAEAKANAPAKEPRKAAAAKPKADDASGGEAAPQAEGEAGFYSRRGRSGFFVMNGAVGVTKYNTQEEADRAVGYLQNGDISPEDLKANPGFTPEATEAVVAEAPAAE